MTYILSMLLGAALAYIVFMHMHKDPKPLEVEEPLKDVTEHFEALMNYDASQIYNKE